MQENLLSAVDPDTAVSVSLCVGAVPDATRCS